MDAGIPIKAPVAGIAMGLIMRDDGRPLVLTDIADAEDFAGDMDFKVAGTAAGITALQMDMKVPGLPPAILAQALREATTGRAFILKHMLDIIDKPRAELSELAPRVESLKIPVNRIKDVIGKGGETIHALTDETGAQIDVKDDGTILIFSHDAAALREAVRQIRALTEEPEVGRVYRDRPVVKITDFGAFVQVLPGQDGLVHVSEINDSHVRHPSDVLKEGDKVSVQLIAIDDQGRLSLSMKRVAKKQEGRYQGMNKQQTDLLAPPKSEALKALQREMLADSEITGGELAKGATQLVWGDGSPEARVIFIGEAPGANEDKLGRPFVGRAGKLLESCLDSIGLEAGMRCLD